MGRARALTVRPTVDRVGGQREVGGRLSGEGCQWNCNEWTDPESGTGSFENGREGSSSECP